MSGQERTIPKVADDVQQICKTIEHLDVHMADLARMRALLFARIDGLRLHRFASCPVCGAERTNGERHDDDCLLMRVLRKQHEEGTKERQMQAHADAAEITLAEYREIVRRAGRGLIAMHILLERDGDKENAKRCAEIIDRIVIILDRDDATWGATVLVAAREAVSVYEKYPFSTDSDDVFIAVRQLGQALGARATPMEGRHP